MPIVVIMRSPLLATEQHHELLRRANLIDDPPAGLLLQTVTDTANDAPLSLEIWETSEHHQRFLHDRMLPPAKSIADETGRSVQQAAEAVTTFAVLQLGIAVNVVNDYGDEVRKMVGLATRSLA